MHRTSPRPDRRQFLALTSVVLLGLLPGLTYARLIREMQGKVTVNGVPAILDTEIQAGDTIRTGPDSNIVFMLGADVYRLGPNASLQVEKWEPEDSSGLLRLVSGGLLGVFGKGDKHIQTPNATIGVRGTGLYLQVEEGRTYFCNCYGTTLVQPEGGQESREVSAEHHLGHYLGEGAGPQAITPAGMLYHTDADLIALEALAGRTPPESFLKAGK